MEEDRYVPGRKMEQDPRVARRGWRGKKRGRIEKTSELEQEKDWTTGQDAMYGVIFLLRPGIGGILARKEEEKVWNL